MKVSAQFHFQNTTKSDVSLLRRWRDIGYIRLRSEHQALDQVSEYNLSLTTIAETLNPGLDLKESDFVNLRPGEEYTELRSFTFPFHKVGRPFAGKLVSDGIHSVTVRVAVWPGTTEQAISLQQALGGSTIMTNPVWSNPVRIEVRSDTPAGSCPTE